MRNLVISFLGRDCPGVVFAVSTFLEKWSCNILEASQTILAGEFAALFIVEAPDDVDAAALGRGMTEELEGKVVDLSIVARPTRGQDWEDDSNAEPFVICVDGPDRPGLIASISGIFTRYRVNIKHMKGTLEKEGQRRAMFVFEVLVPAGCDLTGLKTELEKRGHEHVQRVTEQQHHKFD